MDLPDRVAVDSCALIKWALGEPVAAAMDEWIRLAITLGQVHLGGSTMLLVEARGGGVKEPNPIAEQKIIALLDDPQFTLIDTSRRVGLRARGLALAHGLGNYDAVHVASAVEFGADVLFTTDKRLLRARVIAGVEVLEPYMPGNPTLFDHDPDD